MNELLFDSIKIKINIIIFQFKLKISFFLGGLWKKKGKKNNSFFET